MRSLDQGTQARAGKFAITDRIRLRFATADKAAGVAIAAWSTFIAGETLAVSLDQAVQLDSGTAKPIELGSASGLIEVKLFR